jgi:hypothetical protein
MSYQLSTVRTRIQATPAAQGATATIASSLTDRGAVVGATSEATANGVVGDLVSVHYSAEAEFTT